LLDSEYMTAITLSTVGFREVEPLSDSGKLFLTVYILLNIGIFAYVVSTITTYIFEGEFQKIFKNLKFEREVNKLKEDSENGFSFGPKHDTQIGQKDVLILLGSEECLNRFKEYLN